MRRACVEVGLRARLAAALPTPPSREAMVNGFFDLYAGGAAAPEAPRLMEHLLP